MTEEAAPLVRNVLLLVDEKRANGYTFVGQNKSLQLRSWTVFVNVKGDIVLSTRNAGRRQKEFWERLYGEQQSKLFDVTHLKAEIAPHKTIRDTLLACLTDAQFAWLTQLSMKRRFGER